MTALIPSPVTWKDVLEGFRRKESRDAVLLMRRDTPLQKLLVAWPTVCARPSLTMLATTFQRTDPYREATWEWLWWMRFPEGVPFNRWAQTAGLNVIRNWHAMERARDAQLVYPDGEIHSTCLGFLHHLTAKEFK